MLLVYDTVNYTPKVEINIIVPDVSRAAGYHAMGSVFEAGDSNYGTLVMILWESLFGSVATGSGHSPGGIRLGMR